MKNNKNKEIEETEYFVKSVVSQKSSKALKHLENILKRKVAKRITDTLSSSSNKSL